MTAPRHERARAGVGALARDPVPLPADARGWLARLARLEGVPFDALVPVAAMLPPESIRFFHVDQNWLDALVDGALSIAGPGGDERALVAAMRPHVRGVAAPAPAQPWTGVLLRSSVVAEYPGLRVKAHPDAAGKEPALGNVRVDVLSPAVLLAIFDGVAQRVEIAKPGQVLHFGVEPVGESGPPWEVPLRGIGIGSTPLGEEIEGQSAPLALRDDPAGRQVVDVLGTLGQLETALGTALGTAVTLGPATMGVQLVQGAERAIFAASEAT